MKLLITAAMAIMLVLLVSCSECTTTPQAPPATPLPTATPPLPTTAPPVPTSTPEPLRTLPDAQQVDLQLSKDRTYSDIILHYNGGKGLLFIQKIMMRVTRSDGTQEMQYMRDGQKPRQGDEIVIRGTRGSDRCEVYVTTTSGITYKVKDESLMIGGAYQGN
jgi:hypothetical protein